MNNSETPQDDSLSVEGSASEIEPWLKKFLDVHNYKNLSSNQVNACRSRMLQMATYEELGFPKELLPQAAQVFGGLLRKMEEAHKNEKINPQQTVQIFNVLLNGHATEKVYEAMNGNAKTVKTVLELELNAYEKLLEQAGVPSEQWPLVFEKLMPTLTDDIEGSIKKLLNKECTVEDIISYVNENRDEDVLETTKKIAAQVLHLTEG